MTTVDSSRALGVDSTSIRRPAGDEPLVVHLAGRPSRWTSSRRQGRRIATAIAVALAAALATAAAGFALAAAADEGGADGALGPGVVTVEVGIEMSRFDLGTLRVREGTLVELVVRNDDPIDHELVVGDAEVHRRHADGTEGRHPPVPGEVSVAPGARAMTFYRFDDPGTVTYACHLPGHAAYGMVGQIEVIPA
jgi:uncharacterized cupredoxin-like copper-binding protein